MSSKISRLTRGKARGFLEHFRQARAEGRITEVMILNGSDWIHPATEERLDQCEALENLLERMLERRAGF